LLDYVSIGVACSGSIPSYIFTYMQWEFRILSLVVWYVFE